MRMSLFYSLKQRFRNRICGARGGKLSVNMARSVSNICVAHSPASGGVSIHTHCCWCCPGLVPSRPASGADTAHGRLVEQITAQALCPFIDYTPQ